MELAIKDSALYLAGYATVAEGLSQLGISTVEVRFTAGGYVRSLTGPDLFDLTSPDGLTRIADELRRLDLRICAFHCSPDFNGDDQVAQIDWLINAVWAADALKVPVVRLDSTMYGQGALPVDDCIRIYSNAVREVVSATSESRVSLGIENHDRYGSDPEWMGSVIDGVDSPRLGCAINVGNWYRYGHSLSDVYRLCAEFTSHMKIAHLSNLRRIRDTDAHGRHGYWVESAPLDEGDLNLEHVAILLRHQGFDGPLVIHDEAQSDAPTEARLAILKRNVDHLRSSVLAASV